jgi:hypothetical protein
MFKPSEIAKFSRTFDDSSLQRVYQMSLQSTGIATRWWAGRDNAIVAETT